MRKSLICVNGVTRAGGIMRCIEPGRIAMYQRILVCTDGSQVGQRAAREGIELAAALRASAIALLVTPPFEPPEGYEAMPLAAQIERHARESTLAAERSLDAIAKIARDLGVRCRTLHVGRYPPAATIVETATQERCDLIVMGSHGHGALGQLFLGSVATRVAATCAVPILIVRNAPARPARPPRKAAAPPRASRTRKRTVR